jgi:hypothetical protein
MYVHLGYKTRREYFATIAKYCVRLRVIIVFQGAQGAAVNVVAKVVVARSDIAQLDLHSEVPGAERRVL